MEVETVADEMDAEAPKYSFDSLCAFPEDARAWDALLREAKPDTGPFAKFWALLLASDVADGARLCNFGACDALGRPACGPRLFLRECFARLWNAIRTVQRPFCRVAVAGGPGVGKTMFMAYCLLRLSKADPAPLIALDLGHGKAMRFIRGPDVRRVSDPDAIEELLECRSCVYLSDGVPPRDCCGRAIYFAADGRAAPAAFHGLLCRRLFLPPWTLDEMQICGILCHPDVPESEIRRCFALFGGRAGVVFPHARRAEALIETRRAIRSSDVEGVLEAAEEWCVGGGLGQGDRVLVSVPGPDFGSVSCGFHSQYVADEWVRAAARDRAAGLWGAVAGGRGEACGGVVESAWEAAAHNLLPGRRWVVRGGSECRERGVAKNRTKIVKFRDSYHKLVKIGGVKTVMHGQKGLMSGARKENKKEHMQWATPPEKVRARLLYMLLWRVADVQNSNVEIHDDDCWIPCGGILRWPSSASFAARASRRSGVSLAADFVVASLAAPKP
ncbi:unnamed protein product [Ostreobium quekettii]|uniref:Uncharacterized protein n=1 Tax=Ostreobium quekettii TaxID=121088 RepID=A0A8S1J6I7_9CHLO|nr:unnamed protein product [Ostreobium quekettii]